MFVPIGFFAPAGGAAPVVPTTNLQMWIDAGNASSYPGSGTTWYDLSGNGNDFLIQNINHTSGDAGYFDFPGDSTYWARIATPSFGTPPDDFTIIGIYAADDWTPVSTQYVVNNGMDNGQQGAALWIDATRVRGVMRDSVGVATANHTWSTPPSNFSWIMHVFERTKGGTNTLRVGTTSLATVADPGGDITANDDWIIGRTPIYRPGGSTFDGKFSTMLFYDAILSATDLQAIYDVYDARYSFSTTWS